MVQRSKKRCGFCHREFSKTDHLERHLRSHTKEKPFTCNSCDKQYGRSDSLLRHQAAHHDGGRGGRIATEGSCPRQSALSVPSETYSEPAQHWQTIAEPESNPPAFSIPPSGTSFLQRDAAELISSHNIGFVSAAPFTPSLLESSSTNLQRLEFLEAPGQTAIATPGEAVQRMDTAFNHALSAGAAEDRTAFLHQSVNLDCDLNLFAWDNFDSDNLNSLFLAPSPFGIFDNFSQVPHKSNPQPRESASLRHEQSDLVFSLVEKLWFTRLESENSTPSVPERSRTSTPPEEHGWGRDLDEPYRLSLSNRLRPGLMYADDTLPSSEFLKMCVYNYICRVNPIFPILHAPTLRPTRFNGSLFLSICSVGSLFLGTAQAAYYGCVLYERLLKSMNQSWDYTMSLTAEEHMPMLQTALIGQTFALLSDDPRHLALLSAYHGGVISWARRAKVFNLGENENFALDESSGPQLANSWSRWARREESKRAALGIYIHDAEVAALFHHEPIFRHRRRHIIPACSTNAFSARTADSWVREIKEDFGAKVPSTYQHRLSPLADHLPTPNRPLSPFTAYSILAGIGASISEDRSLGQYDATSSKAHESDLISWYKMYGADARSGTDPHGLLILWHQIFMSNLVDLDRLEMAVGKKGMLSATPHAQYVTEWTKSIDSKRCLVHSCLLQKRFEERSPGSIVAIHVPRCLFAAAITWSAYLRTASLDSLTLPSERNITSPELDLLGLELAGQWCSIMGVREGRLSMMRGTLCRLADMLREIHPWSIAQRFSRILAPLIHGHVDDYLLSPNLYEK